MVTFGQRSFTTVRGSDVHRNGMYLELGEIGGKQGLAEVFFSDSTSGFTLNTFDNDVPLEVIEWLAAQAHLSLPPDR